MKYRYTVFTLIADLSGACCPRVRRAVEYSEHYIYDKLLLILFEESMASYWVAHEVRRTYDREQKEGKRVLFPIRLCDYEALAEWDLYDGGRDLALDVRHYHDAFETAFARLYNDLKAV